MASLKLVGPTGHANVLFLHVPKTAGIWMCQLFKTLGIHDKTFRCPPWEWVHGTFSQCQDGTDWAFSFAVSRERESWYRSVYRYTIQEEGAVKTRGFNGPLLDYSLDYATWRDQAGGWYDEMESRFRPVDHVIDFHNLVEGTIVALQRAGYEFNREVVRREGKMPVNKTGG